jgi:two-component system chemotaxis response regulator CheB
MTERAIVVGVSSGGMNALSYFFSALPSSFSTPIIVVQHSSARSDGEWISLLNDKCKLHVCEAGEKEVACAGNIYIAPANYHLLIERNKTFTITIDEKVNFARPSIDVLFESAADAYGKHLTGVILTGANNDGAAGLQYVKEMGGRTIVQDPATAESPVMPASAIELVAPDYILSLEKIVELLVTTENKNKPE